MRGKRTPKVHVITMGCPKNVVDSEKLMAQLRLNDIELASTIEEADIAVINTCGFIEAAREESIDAIIGQVKRKGRGKLRKVYAMGCLSERYGTDLQKEIPEVDGFFGVQESESLLRELGADWKSDRPGERVLTTAPHLAYLKVSEGCDNPCSFCAIPLMRGAYVSRPLEDIVDEARLLARRGVVELVVVGQDTTFYGMDLYGKRRLAELLACLADIGGIRWVRLLYAYPTRFPMDVLDVMAEHPNLCKYLDLPVQHVSDVILKSMRRGMSSRALIELIAAIRERVPGITLRSTLIVGYPGEGVREFEELMQFVRETRFDRLGVFSYSPEVDTPAFPLGDPVSNRVKQQRMAMVMEAQEEISQDRNSALIGSTQTVLIDRVEGGSYVGRTESDAPEIDNEVFFAAEQPLAVGTFCRVEILDGYEYDLFGRAS